MNVWREGFSVSTVSCQMLVLSVFTYPYIFLLCVGNSGAFYLTEGDSPTPGEAERREGESPAAAEGADGASESAVWGDKVFWGSESLQVRH